MELVSRGLSSFKVGQLLVIGFNNMMELINDDNDETRKEKFEEAQKQMVRVPALIIKKTEDGYNFPTYDLYFWTRGRNGEASGALKLADFSIWRYMSADVVEEGTPPDWILESIEQELKEYNDVQATIEEIMKDPLPFCLKEFSWLDSDATVSDKDQKEFIEDKKALVEKGPLFLDIPINEICYIKPGPTPDEDYWFYPFKDLK